MQIGYQTRTGVDGVRDSQQRMIGWQVAVGLADCILNPVGNANQGLIQSSGTVRAEDLSHFNHGGLSGVASLLADRSLHVSDLCDQLVLGVGGWSCLASQACVGVHVLFQQMFVVPGAARRFEQGQDAQFVAFKIHAFAPIRTKEAPHVHRCVLTYADQAAEWFAVPD